MSTQDNDPPAAGSDGEPMLQRWSRLKSRAREAERNPAPTPGDPGSNPVLETRAVSPAERAPSGEPPRVELPDLDLLDQDSDYSAFLSPGVEPALRQRALRKLFASPKFNVFDGLDTYRDDFTSFPALGGIVTADMRHQVERLAKEALAKLEQDAAAAPGTAASEAGKTAPEPGKFGEEPHAIPAEPSAIDAIATETPPTGNITTVRQPPAAAMASTNAPEVPPAQSAASRTEKD